ncbi:HPr family phosphocarrier protein [Planctomicrobium sp. SH668]|uniref:HPr family phosphocarrier protein n=1 Tax=Planctomicrobium sp. SH668 TaxID=3448126 RepID=UPI003F5C54A8
MSSIASVTGSDLIIRRLQLQLAQGLHLRACSRIVAIVGANAGQVRIRCGDRVADAGSMFDLIQLVAVPGAELVIECDDDSTLDVLEKLERYLSQTSDSAE